MVDLSNGKEEEEADDINSHTAIVLRIGTIPLVRDVAILKQVLVFDERRAWIYRRRSDRVFAVNDSHGTFLHRWCTHLMKNSIFSNLSKF